MTDQTNIRVTITSDGLPITINQWNAIVKLQSDLMEATKLTALVTGFYIVAEREQPIEGFIPINFNKSKQP